MRLDIASDHWDCFFQAPVDYKQNSFLSKMVKALAVLKGKTELLEERGWAAHKEVRFFIPFDFWWDMPLKILPQISWDKSLQLPGHSPSAKYASETPTWRVLLWQGFGDGEQVLGRHCCSRITSLNWPVFAPLSQIRQARATSHMNVSSCYVPLPWMRFKAHQPISASSSCFPFKTCQEATSLLGNA